MPCISRPPNTTQRSCRLWVRPFAINSSNAVRSVTAWGCLGGISFFTRKMQFEHAAFAHFVELLRRRLVPRYIRREQERQEAFDARYCESSTESPSTENTDSDNDSL